MSVVYVGLGSNLAEPRAQIERALTALAEAPYLSLLQRSRLYRSAPWGMRDQPEFINAVAEIESPLPARGLLQELLNIEQAFGRDRGGKRWGPRILDLDLLLYGDRIVDEPGLRVPHPHLHERAFVLLPLMEMAPHLDIPGHGPIAGLLDTIDTSTCHLLESA